MIRRNMLGHKLNAKAAFKGLHNLTRYQKSGQQVYPITDLTKYDNLILDQGQEGDCTAASSGGSWMYLQLLKWRLKNPGYTMEQFQAVVNAQAQVSMDFIYALELTHDGDFGADNGSFGATAALVLSTFGACYDDFWPNTGLGYMQYPSSTAIAAAAKGKVAAYRLLDLKDVRTCLSEGYPLWLGCPVFPSFTNSSVSMETGLIPMPAKFEQPAGGHEMKVIGHNDSEGMLTIDNSWGTDVGIGGRFKMPYAYFEKYVSEAYTGRLL